MHSLFRSEKIDTLETDKHLIRENDDNLILEALAKNGKMYTMKRSGVSPLFNRYNCNFTREIW